MSHSLEPPQDPNALSDWLEEHLVDGSLNDLVAKLTVSIASRELTSDSTNDGVLPSTLAEVLGNSFDSVLSSGLSSLSHEQLQGLLDQPELLLQLRQLLVNRGGEYWEELVDVESRPGEPEASTESTDEAPDDFEQEPPKDPPRIGTIAAGIVIALVAIVIMVRGSGGPWGFESPGLFENQLRSDQYFDTLADAAEGWHDQPRGSRQSLQNRLVEFHRGCGLLIEAAHDQLNPSERAWLLRKTRSFQTRLESMSKQLEPESADHDSILRDADAMVDRMIQSLRIKADEIAADEAITR